ncbi:histidine phosphatase family protein [Wenzhouxiangella sp. AB-CW3]|nr:histidine phosphatase family protein [Wenzhouxiangella sp. AB-CW3]
MTLYIVRHGQTDWNAQDRIQGDTDNPLNDTGIQQAEQVAAQLGGGHSRSDLSQRAGARHSDSRNHR